VTELKQLADKQVIGLVLLLKKESLARMFESSDHSQVYYYA